MMQRTTPDGKTSRAARVGVGALVSLLTLLQLGSAAHFLLVPHEFCPEHGELVHSHHSHHSHHLGSLAAPSSASAVRQPAADSSDELEHDHCLVSLHQRARALSPPVQQSDLLAVRKVQPALPVLEVLPPAVPLLAVAPKNSPPVC